MLSPCLFNLYAEYILQNARLHEAQAGIKIAGRYINNLRWHHPYGRKWSGFKKPLDESQSKEKSEKAGLKLSIQKTKIMASSSITSWQIDGETMETVPILFFGAPKSL